MIRRPRRNRRSTSIRRMLEEVSVSSSHLIYPLFLIDGYNIKNEIASLPGNYQMSADRLMSEIEECVNLGLSNFVLFPVVHEDLKDERASYGLQKNNFYLTTVLKIKERFPEICLISDVAMDPYSSMGHDGFVENGEVINDVTLPILQEMSLVQAQAGFDYIGPSDMMDGRVGKIRTMLDAEGYSHTGILSYTAKYASAFYGPFRDALDSKPKSGDKKSYQMNPANSKEALLEAELDELEGADILMVKPGLHYLDIVKSLSDYGNLPVAAYHVSGECAMLVAAARNGWLDYRSCVEETLLSFRRAGADIILTYFAKDFAKWNKA